MIQPYNLLKLVRQKKPVIHHLTNWVTIYDCANIVKVFGASPVMAHAKEEVEDMVSIAQALVLNIGTLTPDFIDSMILAGKTANSKKIPVTLDVCGAGATRLRNEESIRLLQEIKVAIIKGNASEIAKIAGENVRTKGVDSTDVLRDKREIASILAKKRNCTVVITGKEDIIADSENLYSVKNGVDMMGNIVGTGCMAASVIGTFSTVSSNYTLSSVCGLSCLGIAAELAFKEAKLPGSFKEKLYDKVYSLTEDNINKMVRIETVDTLINTAVS